MKKSPRNSVRGRKKSSGTRDRDGLFTTMRDTPDAMIFSVDTNYTYTGFSTRHADVMKALYGIDIELGKNLLAYSLIPLDRDTMKANLDRALAGELVIDSDYAGNDARTRRLFDFFYIPLRDDTGKITGVLTIAQDAHERKQSEMVLSKGTTLQQMAHQRGQTGNWEYSIKSGKLIWSPEIYRLFNRPVGSEVISFWEQVHLVHPHDRSRFLDAIKNVLENGTPYDIEVRMTLPDGSSKYIHACGEPIIYKGKIVKIAGIMQDATAGKKIESLLKESEEKYRTLVEHVPDLIVVHRDGIILYLNPAAIRVIGYTPEEMLNKPVTDFIVPTYHDHVAAAIRKRMKGELVEPYEIEVLTKSGGRRTALVSGHRIELAGAPASLNVLTDITERKQVEEALRESEERYRTLAETAQDPIYIIDKNDTIAYINAYAADQLGLQKEEIIGKSRSVFFPDAVAKRQWESIEKVFTTGTPVKVESRVPLLTRETWQDTLLVPLKDLKGDVTSVMGISRDITDRRLTEEALRQSEARFRNLMEYIPGVSIQGYRADGTVVYWNKASESVYGYTAEEAVGKNLGDLIVPDELKPLFSECLLLAKNVTVSGEFMPAGELSLLKKDGSRVLVHSIHTAVCIEGKESLFFCIDVDLSERKKAEMALRESEHRLSDIINFLPDATLAIDREGTIIAWNKAIEEMTGVKAEDMLGKGNYEYALPFYGERRPVLIDLIFKSYEDIEKRYYGIIHKKGEVLITETSLARPKGKSGVLWAKASPLYDKRGNVVGAIESIRDITDRKNAEEAVRESEAHLNSILQGSPVPQFVIDRDHRVISWNKALEELSGIKAEDIIGTSQQWKAFYNAERPCLADFLVDEAREKIPEWYAGKYRKSSLVDEAYEATDFFQKIGKEGKWLYFTAAPVRDTKGTIIGAVETLEDITDQKKAEEAVKESEEKFRTVVEYVPDLIMVHRNGIILFLNPASAQVIGYTSNEMLNKPITDFISAEYHERVAAAIRKRMKGEHVEPYEIEILTKSQGRRTIIVRGTRIEFGGSPAILNVLTDITDRKQTEEALKKSEERYRNVVQSQTEFICRFLPDGTHLFVNEAYCNYFGKPCEEIMGHHFAPNIPFLDRQKVRQSFESLTPDNPVATIEHRIIMPDGEVRWQQWIDRAIFDTNGRVTEYQSVGRDITRRKNMEEEIRSLNTVLEQRVMERTAQLNASLKEKETLVREIHHRVKNNLQIIISLLHLQSASIKDTKTLNAIEDSEVRIKAMALVHEKLYQSENLEEIDIENYTRFLVKNLFSFYGSHAQNLNSTIRIHEVRVPINTAIPLGLIVNEIVTNSLKYAFPDKRSGEILISGQRVDDRYEFILGDNGIGMPPDLDWKHTESLGLKLVNMLVDQLEGTIERLPRQGTIFKIIIKKKE